MPEIVKPDSPKPGLFEQFVEDPMPHVVCIEHLAGLVAEKPFWFAAVLSQRLEFLIDEMLLQNFCQSHRHIHPPALPSFWGRQPAVREVASDLDEPAKEIQIAWL